MAFGRKRERNCSSSKPEEHRFIKQIPDDITELWIPRKSLSKIGNALSNVATLKDPNGTFWRIELLKSEDGMIRFQRGWQEFVDFYSLRTGDLLVFEYKGKSKFFVFIYKEMDYPPDPDVPVRKNQVGDTQGEEAGDTEEDPDSSVRDNQVGDTEEDEVGDIEEDHDVSVSNNQDGESGEDVEDADYLQYLAKFQEPEAFCSKEDMDDPDLLKFLANLQESEVSSPVSKPDSGSDSASYRIPKRGRAESEVSYSISSSDSESDSTGYRIRTRGRGKKKLKSCTRKSHDKEDKALERKIVFQSNHLYFEVVLKKTHASSPYQLLIPKYFWSNSLEEATGEATLNFEGKCWSARYSTYLQRKDLINYTKMRLQWRSFAQANKLRIGDSCVFELIDAAAVKFDVHIFRKNG